MREKTIIDVKLKVDSFQVFEHIILENIDVIKDIKPESKEANIVMFTAYVNSCLGKLREHITSQEFKGGLESHCVDNKSNVPPDVFIKHLLAHLDEYTNKVIDLIMERETDNLYDFVRILSKVVADELKKA